MHSRIAERGKIPGKGLFAPANGQNPRISHRRRIDHRQDPSGTNQSSPMPKPLRAHVHSHVIFRYYYPNILFG